jgi:hypothetical protein
MLRILLACVAVAVFGISVVQAQAPPTKPPPVDWNATDERKTACKLYDQRLWNCAQFNNYDQTIIDALRRRCSALR